MAEFLKDFRKKSDQFSENEKCIAFHVRRGDRVLQGNRYYDATNNYLQTQFSQSVSAGKNMIEHCKWIEYKCENATSNKNACLQSNYDYFGLGCHTAVCHSAVLFSLIYECVFSRFLFL